jgi:hypothetical protein
MVSGFVITVENVDEVLLMPSGSLFDTFLSRGVNREMITTVIAARTKARLSREADVFTA